jgi:hypothetical protein
MKVPWQHLGWMALVAVAAPATIFAPSILGLYLFGEDATALAGVWFSTVFAPVLVSFLLFWICTRSSLSRKAAGWAALFGIWYLGFYWDLLITILGGGVKEGSVIFGAMGLVLAPILIFMLSTYTGHLFALFTTTLAVIVFVYRGRRLPVATPATGK